MTHMLYSWLRAPAGPRQKKSALGLEIRTDSAPDIYASAGSIAA